MSIARFFMSGLFCLLLCTVGGLQAEEPASGKRKEEPMPAKAEKLVIVTDAAAGKVERFAAEELQRYLKKITGKKVPISPKAPDGAVVLFVVTGGAAAGKKAFGKEGYSLRSADEGLVLAGAKPRGTLYAVYDFLERLGCRWYYPDPEDEIVPRLSLAEVVRVARGGLGVTEKPDFPFRTYSFLTYDLGRAGGPVSAAVMETLPRLTDWASKNRMNIFEYGIDHGRNPRTEWRRFREMFPEMRKRGLTIGIAGHCWFMFITKGDLRKHPDWKPVVDGKRAGQFCTRNEEAVRFFIGNMIRFLKENPEIEYLVPWPDDTGTWCRCPLCRDTPSADRYMELSRRMYRELKKAVPHVRVSFGAYYTHLVPPENLRPMPGMTFTFSAWGRDMAVPFDDPRTSKQYREIFTQWLDICKQAKVPLILHEKYARHLGLGFHPLPLRVMQEDLRWFRRKGAAGLELPCAYMGRRTKAFNLHVLAKLMWDADADVKAIVDDYFKRCYGKAGGEMRKAYEQVESAQPDMRYWKFNVARTLFRRRAGQQHPAKERDYVDNATKCMAEAQGHVERALRAAGDEAARKRIRRFKQSLDYAHLEWQVAGRIIEAERHLAEAKKIKDAAQYARRIEAAEQALQDARKKSDLREELVTKNPGCGLYWDVTGREGPSRVFKASQIDGWLKLVAQQKRK